MPNSMPLRVVYDYDIFAQQRYGGISRSFAENMKRIERQDQIEICLPFSVSRNAYLREVSSYQGITIDADVRGLGRLTKLIDALQFVPSLYWMDADVYHQTFYNALLSRVRPDVPLIVTVHDMTPELHPDRFDDAEKMHASKKQVCERAHAIICVSENTKRDLTRLYGTDPSKLFVVPHGGGEPVRQKPRIEGPDHYVLFVGKRGGYKNFPELVQELAPLIRREEGPDLVCVGGGPFTSSEIQMLEQCGIRSKTHQTDAADGELDAYYQSATLMVYPSLYEGFGLPLLEAFRNDCPVVASRRSCFPEIAGDAALYFEPGETGSLRASATRVLENATVREGLIDRGRERRKQFTWQRSAQRLREVYERVASSNRDRDASAGTSPMHRYDQSTQRGRADSLDMDA